MSRNGLFVLSKYQSLLNNTSNRSGACARAALPGNQSVVKLTKHNNAWQAKERAVSRIRNPRSIEWWIVIRRSAVGGILTARLVGLLYEKSTGLC